jgi:hypothetical protein
MNKKQKEQIKIYQELSDRLTEARDKNEDYYLGTGYRQELSALNTACDAAHVSIQEDKEWDKYGPHITGRRVAVTDIAAVISAADNLIKAINSSANGIKRQYACTARGKTSYARSAVGVWINSRSGESYRDAAQRMSN